MLRLFDLQKFPPLQWLPFRSSDSEVTTPVPGTLSFALEVSELVHDELHLLHKELSRLKKDGSRARGFCTGLYAELSNAQEWLIGHGTASTGDIFPLLGALEIFVHVSRWQNYHCTQSRVNPQATKALSKCSEEHQNPHPDHQKSNPLHLAGSFPCLYKMHTERPRGKENIKPYLSLTPGAPWAFASLTKSLRDVVPRVGHQDLTAGESEDSVNARLTSDARPDEYLRILHAAVSNVQLCGDSDSKTVIPANLRLRFQRRESEKGVTTFRMFFLGHPHDTLGDAGRKCRWQDFSVRVFRRYDEW